MAEAGENRVPLLLRKEIHEGCPGCKTDLLKQQTKGVPYKHFSFIWLVSLCTALPSTSLYPFIYFMVRDFHIAKREEDVGFYVGILGSAFMVGRALTSILWGVAADRYGRRPVILIGVFSVVVFNTLFGVSSNFWMAVMMRFFLGCFNSLLGTIRAYASEICSQEHRALALSVVSTSRGIGLVIGPAIGGLFAQPAEQFPSVFTTNSIFGRFPYFLPCLVISLYAAGVFALSWWLPETLHIHNGSGNGKTKSSEDEEISQESLLKNWPLISVIIVYCVFSLQEMAYTEIFSMWAVGDSKYGGLNLSSQEVGIVLAISGFGLLLFQFFVYPQFEKHLGPLIVTRLSALVSIPILWSYPYVALLSGITLHVVINVASLLRCALSVSLVTGLFILLNEAVPQHQRGAANGVSMTAMSIFKAIGPAGGGAIYSWSQKRQDAAFFPAVYVDDLCHKLFHTSLAKEIHKQTMHSSSMSSDRGLPGSSLIEYIQASYMAEPFSTKIEFNLIGENHHMRYYLPPDRGHKYIKLFYPDREHVRSILKTVKVPSVLYLRGCDQLQCEIFSPFQNTAGFEIPFPNMTGIEYPFQNFKTLTILELSGMDNLITLPDEISEMNQLQSLNLSHLPIQHFPSDDFFSKLTNLCSLVLKACPNLHSLPKFSNLTALVSLDLSYLLIKAFPDGIFTNLKKLHKLILRGCSNLHSLPSIEPLKSLKFLDISNNTLHCTTTLLAFNPTLTHVFARYAKGSVCDYLVHHEQIFVLDLSGAQDLGENFQLREYPPRLKALDISRTSIKSIDVQPPTFCNSHLEILLIRNCSSLVELSAMKRLKSLRVLSLTGCNSLCVLPEDLCELVMLRELNLSGCTSLTELREGVFDKMDLLEKLDLSKTNFKHLPSFAKLISLRTRLILPRGLVLQVPELSSDFESKNLVIVEADVASFDLKSEDQEGNIPNEFHLVSTFINTDSSFYRFNHEFRRVKDSILDIQSKIEANSPDTNIVSKKHSRTMLDDLEYILENIDLLESADLKGNAMNLLDRLMDVVGHDTAHDFDRLKELLRLVCKLKLLIPCPQREDFDSKKMKDIGQDSDNTVSRLYENLQSDDFRYYILLKSYNSLTKAQRSCLLYLSIFPMNSDCIEIKQRTLIQLWYGEGFIDDARDEQNVAPSSRASSSTNTSHILISSADTVEEIGRKILLILQVKGFINKRSNNSRTFIMDEMVHCFLRKKAKEDHFIDLEDQNWKLTPQLTSGSEIALLLNSRYRCPSSCQLWLSYANTRQKEECCKKIRVLFNVNERTIDLRAEWFSKMRNLSVLDIGTWESEYKYIEIVDLNFLEELKNMKQLRVLSFEGVAGITKLPDSVCQLTLLKILNLRECSQMEELPDGIGSLHNLSHLDVTNCPLLSMLPKGIKLLSKLEVLKGFLITYDVDGCQNKKACTLADLVKLEKLRKLNLVVNIDKFPSNEDLQVFKEVKNLCNLKITWLRNRYIDQDILDSMGRKASRRSRWQHLKCWEGLTPQNEETEEPLRTCYYLEKLKKLVLCCFPSETVRDWLHPIELHNLEKLYIIGGHLKTLLPAYTNQKTSWHVKALHLDHTLKLDIEWESLVQIFPNLKLLIKLPQDHLSNFPVDDDGLWKGL